MKPYHQAEVVEIYCGDCIEVMAEMPENSVDAVVTDPPYGLEFMGKEWDKLWRNKSARDRVWMEQQGNTINTRRRNAPDYGQSSVAMQEFHQQWATQALRVLKPGGYLLAFGGTRTYHRLVCGLDDAGFEIRDTLMWLHGQGFPKSMDISKQIDKMAGTEREVIGFDKSKWRDASKYSGGKYSEMRASDYESKATITAPATEAAKEWQGWGTALKPAFEPIVVARKPISEKNVASNVLKWGTGGLNIDESRIETNGIIQTVQGQSQKQQSGEIYSGRDQRNKRPFVNTLGRWPANVILDEEAGRMLDEKSGELSKAGNTRPIKDRSHWTSTFGIGNVFTNPKIPGDQGGGASRFFYCPKASKAERGEGNTHPTAKPIALMEYLIKLVTRQGATVLDPFAGSMTTVLAAVALNRRCIAIEQSEDYCRMLKNRCRQMSMELV